jgi:hypothetical protein
MKKILHWRFIFINKNKRIMAEKKFRKRKKTGFRAMLKVSREKVKKRQQ